MPTNCGLDTVSRIPPLRWPSAITGQLTLPYGPRTAALGSGSHTSAIGDASLQRLPSPLPLSCVT